MKLRFQYTLRTLLLVVFLVACFLSWLMPIVRKAQRQRQAIVVIRALGGGVSYECSDEDTWCGDGLDSAKNWQTWRGWLDDMSHDVVSVTCNFKYSPDVSKALEHLPHVKFLSIGSSDLTGNDLLALKSLPELESLVIYKAPGLKNDDFQVLESLPQLKRLILNDVSVTDVVLEYLKNSPSLNVVNLTRIEIQGDGLRCLVDNKKLLTLKLFECMLSGEGVRAIGCLSQLEWLVICDCTMPSLSLDLLDGFHNLKWLGLFETGLSEDALASLPLLPSLGRLDLAEPLLDGRSLRHLSKSKLPSLKILTVLETQVTPEDVQPLKDEGVLVCLGDEGPGEAGKTWYEENVSKNAR